MGAQWAEIINKNPRSKLDLVIDANESTAKELGQKLNCAYGQNFPENFEKGQSSSLDSQEPIDIAREFSRFFSSHSLKVYKLLLEIERKLDEKSTPLLMDLPNLAVVDVGCGGGAFSIAIINLLHQYNFVIYLFLEILRILDLKF